MCYPVSQLMRRVSDRFVQQRPGAGEPANPSGMRIVFAQRRPLPGPLALPRRGLAPRRPRQESGTVAGILTPARPRRKGFTGQPRDKAEADPRRRTSVTSGHRARPEASIRTSPPGRIQSSRLAPFGRDLDDSLVAEALVSRTPVRGTNANRRSAAPARAILGPTRACARARVGVQPTTARRRIGRECRAVRADGSVDREAPRSTTKASGPPNSDSDLAAVLVNDARVHPSGTQTTLPRDSDDHSSAACPPSDRVRACSELAASTACVVLLLLLRRSRSFAGQARAMLR